MAAFLVTTSKVGSGGGWLVGGQPLRSGTFTVIIPAIDVWPLLNWGCSLWDAIISETASGLSSDNRLCGLNFQLQVP